jgi:multidrug transporter EmrE-like cation transporter
MTPFIAGLVLLAALLHASWNAMAKSGGTPQYSIASYRLISAICCLPLLFIFPIPLAASWPMLLASMIIHTAYYVTLSMSYRSGDLSQVYPLFRGLAPVLVVLGAALLAGEFLPLGAMLGIGLVSAGLISITFAGGTFGKIPAAALGWGLATSVLIAAYTVADGMGVRAAGNPFSYIRPRRLARLHARQAGQDSRRRARRRDRLRDGDLRHGRSADGDGFVIARNQCNIRCLDRYPVVSRTLRAAAYYRRASGVSRSGADKNPELSGAASDVIDQRFPPRGAEPSADTAGAYDKRQRRIRHPGVDKA